MNADVRCLCNDPRRSRKPCSPAHFSRCQGNMIRFHRSPPHGTTREYSGRSVPELPVSEMAVGTTRFSDQCQAVMLSRLLFNAAVEESNVDSAAATDLGDTLAAASAVAANALAL